MRAITIHGREVGPGHSVYIIAEMSANHGQDFDTAVRIMEAAKEAGADAVKLQTYTPDTLTIDSEKDLFRIRETIWKGVTLYDLYREAYMPWEWQPRLKEIADRLGMDLFSSPFDASAVDFLETLNVPAYKVASFELVDLPLLSRIAATRKPILLSTGMATKEEIAEALRAIGEAGGEEVCLLKCTSAYPAPPEEMNLRTLPDLSEAFGVPVGLSDHSLGSEVALAAVALGACLIEKHFTLSRGVPGPDSSFSMEPAEFAAMVKGIRTVEKALGRISYELSEKEAESRPFRRSLFVVKDMRAGDRFTDENVRSIRPGNGLHTRHLGEVLGKRAARNVDRGTPLSWDLIEGP
jgi:pseudaminic acid synthase